MPRNNNTQTCFQKWVFLLPDIDLFLLFTFQEILFACLWYGWCIRHEPFAQIASDVACLDFRKLGLYSSWDDGVRHGWLWMLWPPAPLSLSITLMVQHPPPLALPLLFVITPVAYFPCNLTRLNVGLSARLGLRPMFEVCFDPSGWEFCLLCFLCLLVNSQAST